MAVVVHLTWRGVTEAQYERARGLVGWEREAPRGGLLHVAWLTPEGLHVLDVWETAGEFERFAGERLMPAVRGGLGFAGEPEIVLREAHAVLVPR